MPRVSKYNEHRDIVLRLIDFTAQEHSRPPTVRTLAELLDVGVGTMHSYLGRLAEEGFIEWQAKRHRSLRCTHEGIQRLQQVSASRR